MCLDADHFAFLFAHWRAELLSIISGVGLGMGNPNEARRRQMKRVSRAASHAVTISASAEDSDTHVCLFVALAIVTHDTVDSSFIQTPDVDFQVFGSDAKSESQ